MATIKIRFYDREGIDLDQDYDTLSEDEAEIPSWIAHYNDYQATHEGPRRADGEEAWDQFDVIYE